MIAGAVGEMQPGEVLDGRYRIEGVLGHGGFGVVYRATQLDLGRAVAIKVLLPSAFMNPESLKRFRREAELTQHLAHPNTVTLYAYGECASGAPYAVWEMLTGQPLDAVVKGSGAMSVGRVLRIGEQVLKSLIEAHQAGIVHRDIKPANLFLCQFAGEPDFIKVLDFGIAAVGDSGTGQLTREGQSVGTPSYMSPEQVVGDLDVDGRSDLYALGLVMAEMLTGQIVMHGTSGMRICIEQMSDNPVPIPPEVQSSPLGPLIVRATQKKRDRRHGSAAEMLAELQACIASAGAAASTVVITSEFSGGSPPNVAGASLSFGAVSVATKPASTRWIVGGGVALALVVPTIGIAAWSPWEGDSQRSGDSDSGERSGSRATKSKKGKKLKAPAAERTEVVEALEDFRFRGKTAQSLLDAMNEHHFEMKMAPYVSESKSVTTVNYIFGHTLGDSGGTIQFHRYRSRQDAKEAAKLMAGGLATAHDGKLVMGLLLDRDVDKSEEVLEELLR